DWLYRLLLEQLQNFAMREVMVQLKSQHHEFRPIYLGDLRWQNTPGSHRAEAYVYLDATANQAERLSLQINLKGDGNDPASVQGQLYLAARELDLGEWAARQPISFEEPDSLPLKGVLNMQAWGEIANRSLVSAVVEFSPSYLAWPAEYGGQHLAVDGGRILWQQHGRGWILGSDALALVSNDTPWSTGDFKLLYDGERLQGGLDQIALESLAPVMPLIPGLDKQGRKTLLEMAPAGQLRDLRLRWQEGQLAASVSLHRLQWQAVSAIPGLSPLDANLFFDGHLLRASLPAQILGADFGEGFKAPLEFDTPGIELGYDLDSQTLLLPSVRLHNPDVALDAAMALTFGEAAHLSLAAGVEVKNGARAGYYFPRSAMGTELADYLESAIIAGHTQEAAVIWRGELKGFPYEDSSGIFQAGFIFDEATYKFQPDWPAVKDIRLRALFENQRMDLWVDEGMLKGVNAAGAHVYIPELNEQSLLKIEAALATTGPAATAVLQQSPLKKSVGAALDIVQVQGNVRGDLELSIPLYRGGKPDIKGLVLFEDSPVYLRTPGLQLTRLNGELTFANDTIRAAGLNTRLFGQPLELDITGADVKAGYRVNAQLKGGWNLDSLPESLANPLSPYYGGVVAWQGDLALTLPSQGDWLISAAAQSSLRNAELNLPAPFAKGAGTPMPFTLALNGSADRLKLDLTLDDKGRFESEILPATGNMSSFLLTLTDSLAALDAKRAASEGLENSDPEPLSDVADSSQEAPAPPEYSATPRAGQLEVSLQQATFELWLPIIMGFVNQGGEVVGESFFPPLTAINTELGSLSIFGQELSQTRIQARPEHGLWRIGTESAEFEGDIDFFPDWHTGGLKLRAKRLYLAPAFNDQESAFTATDIAVNLPPLAVDVDDFRLFSMPLGHLVMQASPEADGYRFQTVSLESEAATLSGQGLWQTSSQVNETRMNFTVNAEKFDALSDQLGINPGIKDSPLDISAELFWRGAPHEFELGNLSGGIRFNLGKGSLSEISDKGARIFSLFSLDSLLRKLSLDFTDVFGKGLFYNSFGGNLELDNGVVKTRDTEIDAIAGNMKVRGYTDLATQSLNYDIRFVPQLASSVPTVVLLSTSAWTMGLGAFALTKVLEPVIEVISEIRFRLTGTMKDPVLEELERKSKEIEIPESVLPRKPDEASPDADKPREEKPGEQIPPEPVSKPEQAAEPEKAQPQQQAGQEEKTPPLTNLLPVTIPLQWSPSKQFSQVSRTGESHADKPAAMSEQPRCGGQSGLCRIAA
ncbi:YhdP family protein, partial [Shewanella sp.]|uniref:YhdP family protein n=1 Tax=Shewanella sp. TaxID=50422 RepID=UPI0035663C67